MYQRQNLTGYVFIVVIVTIGLFIVAAAVAQTQARGRGQMRDVPFYNAATEVTLAGVVDDVQQIARPREGAAGQMWPCPKGWTGTHLRLKTETGTLPVHVGPSAYLTIKKFTIVKGDKLTVRGSRVQYQGSEMLIAREITKGNEVLILRNAAGFPLWTGFRLGSTPLPGTSGE